MQPHFLLQNLTQCAKFAFGACASAVSRTRITNPKHWSHGEPNPPLHALERRMPVTDRIGILCQKSRTHVGLCRNPPATPLGRRVEDRLDVGNRLLRLPTPSGRLHRQIHGRHQGLSRRFRHPQMFLRALSASGPRLDRHESGDQSADPENTQPRTSSTGTGPTKPVGPGRSNWSRAPGGRWIRGWNTSSTTGRSSTRSSTSTRISSSATGCTGSGKRDSRNTIRTCTITSTHFPMRMEPSGRSDRSRTRTPIWACSNG